jgi:hypothetical protein
MEGLVYTCGAAGVKAARRTRAPPQGAHKVELRVGDGGIGGGEVQICRHKRSVERSAQRSIQVPRKQRRELREERALPADAQAADDDAPVVLGRAHGAQR